MIRTTLTACLLLGLCAPLRAAPASLGEKLSEAGVVFRLGGEFSRELGDEDLDSRTTTNGNGTIDLDLAFLTIRDLNIITNLPLEGLGISYSDVETLIPLTGLQLKRLELAETKVSDLSPLIGMPLEKLVLSETEASDLSPLEGMPLTELNLCGADVSSLEPLRGMPIETLDIDGNKQTANLSALAGMPLLYLKMQDIPVTDLSPLRNSPLKSLVMTGAAVKDLSPLADLSLENIQFTTESITNGLHALRDMQSLKSINGVAPNEFFEMLEMDRLALTYDIPRDSALAKNTQTAIDALREMTTFTEWPDCIQREPWANTVSEEENFQANFKAFKKIGDYLGYTVLKKSIANDDSDWSDTIEVSKRKRKTIYVDPKVLSRENTPVDETAFDVNEYFKALPHLHLAEGYTLDYIYLRGGVAPGTPLVYGRRSDAPWIHSHQLYHFLIREQKLEQDAYRPYTELLEANDSTEGFLQLAIFEHVCEQFYGGYQLGPLIASHQGMNEFLGNVDNFMRYMGNKKYPLPLEIQEKARAIDPTPTVELSKSKAVVTLVGFSNWKGFYRRTFEYSRLPPHAPSNESLEILVPYNCGIIY